MVRAWGCFALALTIGEQLGTESSRGNIPMFPQDRVLKVACCLKRESDLD
jgi:hypothetical protein